MNTRTKRRMMAVTGIIVIVLVVILAVVGGSGAAKSATVADAVAGKYADQKIQVTGNVVENSYATNDNVLTFAIYDKDGNPAEQLNVRYEGGVSATFGNDVTAICTGKIAGDGVLHATELVTKCPSKYENADSAHFGRRKAYLSLSIDGKDSGWYGQPANGERARKTFDVVSNALLSQRRRSRNLAAEMLRGKNRSG